MLDGGDLRVDRLVLRDVGVGVLLRRERHLGLDVAEDRRLERVVVLLRDRIELVVVAARAIDGEAERPLADRAEDLVEVVVAPLRIVLLAEQHARAHAQEAGRDEAVVGLAVHLVAGNLLDEEPVVRLVVVERLDHVVAVAPRVRPMHVVLEAGGVGVARDVEPEPAVALAVVRRREQRIDQMLPRVRRLVADERVHLRRRRRQAEEIEVGAPHERVPIGARRRLQPARAARGLEESIDWIREA